jgi:hypothetical protein
MPNKHIKVINGRKYYYQSIRIGKKVTSKYLGPVENRKRRARMQQEEIIEASKSSSFEEENYIG